MKCIVKHRCPGAGFKEDSVGGEQAGEETLEGAKSVSRRSLPGWAARRSRAA